MNKRTVLILSLVSLALVVVGFVVLTATGASCPTTTAAGCSSAAGPALAGLLVILVGSVAGLIAWILGLIKTAQIGRWGWFVAVLLLGSLGALIYGLAGPTERAMA